MTGWACGFDGGVHAEFGRGDLKRMRRRMDVNEISMGGDVHPVSTTIEIF
jgi:hypothetical protein